MASSRIILGIESSCDDTAAAVLVDGRVVSSVVSTQLEHAEWGGVVPELASRAHDRMMWRVVDQALTDAGLQSTDLEAIAVTAGPGLIGSLLVGVSFAKAASLGLGIPLIAVNHLDGHLASLHLTDHPPTFPHLCLIVSGGHTQLMRVEAPGETTLMGRTRDDAAGEAFDKVGKILGLPYPGGPEIDARAARGDMSFHAFPRTRLQGFDWSFSGIKTAVLYYLNAMDESERARHLEAHIDDVCASFQEAVVDMLVAPLKRAMRETGIREVGLVGGVSANRRLRSRLTELTESFDGRLIVPPMDYCMDNAAMIAMAGYHMAQANRFSDLTVTANPSLALT